MTRARINRGCPDRCPHPQGKLPDRASAKSSAVNSGNLIGAWRRVARSRRPGAELARHFPALPRPDPLGLKW